MPDRCQWIYQFYNPRLVSSYKCFNLKVELNLSPASFPSHWWIVGLVDIWLSLLSIKCHVISAHCHLKIEFTRASSRAPASRRFVLVCPIKAITLSNFIIVSQGNSRPRLCINHTSLASALRNYHSSDGKMGFRSLRRRSQDLLTKAWRLGPLKYYSLLNIWTEQTPRM